MSGGRTLGPTSEALIREAFANSLTITAKAAARLLGCDVRTLGSMTDSGLLRAVRRGKLRAYVEADIRAYLLDSPSAEASNGGGGRHTVRRAKVVRFSDRKRSRS